MLQRHAVAECWHRQPGPNSDLAGFSDRLNSTSALQIILKVQNNQKQDRTEFGCPSVGSSSGRETALHIRQGASLMINKHTLKKVFGQL